MTGEGEMMWEKGKRRWEPECRENMAGKRKTGWSRVKIVFKSPAPDRHHACTFIFCNYYCNRDSREKWEDFTWQSHKSSQLTAIPRRPLAPKFRKQPWRTAAVADISLSSISIAAAAYTVTAAGTTNNVPQAFDTAKSVAAENQPAGVDVMMAIHNNNTEGAIPLRPSLH